MYFDINKLTAAKILTILENVASRAIVQCLKEGKLRNVRVFIVVCTEDGEMILRHVAHPGELVVGAKAFSADGTCVEIEGEDFEILLEKTQKSETTLKLLALLALAETKTSVEISPFELETPLIPYYFSEVEVEENEEYYD